MKKIFQLAFVTIFVFTLTACQQQKVLNRQIKTESGERFLTGEFDREALNQKHYASWFNEEYNTYEVEESKLKNIKKLDVKFLRIEVFVGTWCSDSQRELPRFYKILESVKFPIESRLKVYGVDHKKKSFYGEEIGKDITHVPTIIVYKNGKEIGRIVEGPVSGYLEEDFEKIVNGTPLTPNYAEE
ncbi:TlpA family protein disulfide reductase [Faecalibacter bovis]|uniref:Thioredoxin family protein n=1 Tax=Faecalibacter bovis TaxID=2898187 RepID=A0ABX7XCY8_9FLAO|nr:thioredoxin family protein [Faecalibacter bovis]MBS7333909.1 thioredoxin family protein [Weeksellaceae bacterium]QTV05737.1 thioredoxin family protein [Faecalibacter bovis]